MAPAPRRTVTGAGLGLRRALLGPLSEQPPDCVDFFEVAPENWMDIGGRLGRQFRAFTERHSMVCHGLSLNLGGPAPLDESFLRQLKRFMSEHGVALYSEHLSYCADDGHLFDLMPIPFTEEAVHHVAARIRRAQDILEQRIAIENVSYYAAPGKEMNEADFVCAVVEEADCDLLLDINNAYVNGANHGYDPWDFIRAMPADRIAYLHIAGHYREGPDLIIDTHGASVVGPVWDLLGKTYGHFGVIPTLLERDFDLPPLAGLLEEVGSIVRHQTRWSASHEHRLRYA